MSYGQVSWMYFLKLDSNTILRNQPTQNVYPVSHCVTYWKRIFWKRRDFSIGVIWKK